MWATVLVSLCTLVLVLYLWGGRLILRICSLVLKNWRLTSRGFEWDDDPNVVVPTFLARRLNFEWGGWTEWRRGTSGLMVMKVSGISYRQRRKTVDAGDKKQEVAPSARSFAPTITFLKTSILPHLVNLFLHHSSWLPSVFQIKLCDIRVICDDLCGMEGTVSEIVLGLKVDFEGFEVENQTEEPTVPTAPPTDYMRGHPLETSPPASPLVFTSLFSPFAPGSTPASPSSPDDETSSQISLNFNRAKINARSGVNKSLKGFASSASHFWTRAIGRAHGSVSATVEFYDVAVILPHDNAPKVELDQSTPKPRAMSLRTMPSLPALLRRISTPRYLPNEERGYEKLVFVSGVSTIRLSMSFGPKIGLLGESAFKTRVRIGALQTNFASMEKIKEILEQDKAKKEKRAHEEGKMSVEKAKELFSSHALPRILLRAFAVVTVSFSSISISHFLPSISSGPSSAASSYTDVTTAPEKAEAGFTLALSIDTLRAELSAVDASTSKMAKNAFGSNAKAECCVRGIGFNFSWKNVALYCIAPGEEAKDRTELFAAREADVEGISTWRPSGWAREELLFAGDPNIALIVCKNRIASIDGAADVQLLSELSAAWKQSRPAAPAKAKARSVFSSEVFGLPPRIRLVLDIGNIMFVLADRVSGQRATLSMATDGIHFGCFTSFEDVIARRRDAPGNRKAFAEEAGLYERRNATTEYDPLLPPSMLKPKFRRTYHVEQASLLDDLAIRMRMDANVTMEPLAIHMSLGDQDSREQTTHRLASIGQLYGTFVGTVMGTVDVAEDGSDRPNLLRSTLSSTADIGIDQGIKAYIAEMPVIQALEAMGEQYGQYLSPEKQAEKKSFFDRIPSGVATRISLGTISVFIGHNDLNPNEPLHIVRGIWIQTSAAIEYAYFNNRAQCMKDRMNTPNSAQRKALQLADDIATQAVAFYNQVKEKDGRAALGAITLNAVTVKPVYNGKRFAEAGGVAQRPPSERKPSVVRGPSFRGWDFKRGSQDDEIRQGDFTNTDVAENAARQVQRSLLVIPSMRANITVIKPHADAETSVKLSPFVKRIEVVGDMSHVYCCLLASLTIRKIAKAWKRPKAAREKRPLDLSMDVRIPVATFDLTFPLHERLFFYTSDVDVSKLPNTGIVCAIDQTILYVPSPSETGQFEEYARLKGLKFASAVPGSPPAFDIKSEFLRLRVPYSFVSAKPILNVNVTIKAAKTLMKNLKSGEFSIRHEPAAEEPKSVPPISFSSRAVRIEFMDNSLEQNLNLIFRAGQVEQAKRNELEDLFEQKINLLAKADVNSSGDSLEEERRNATLTKEATVPIEEARIRLDWQMSRTWHRRITVAHAERRRREVEKGRFFHISGPLHSLPITIARHAASPPLFRMTFHNVGLNITSLAQSRDEVIQLMSDLSTPFAKDTEFSLMVPLHLRWTMDGGEANLRDYPLPLICIPPTCTPGRPAWEVDTPFIIAEELHGEETWFPVPTEILPPGIGAVDAQPLRIEVQKTITPVKTYARPMIRIHSKTKTDFTWGNSYQPAIQDFMRVIDTISHPPKDPSDKPGFWDKLRLTIHWQVQMDVSGPVHLHLKGSYDPYKVSGHGTGFAFVWKGGTRLRVGHPNEQYETIQIEAPELLVVIPDLTALDDARAIGDGRDETTARAISPEEELIQRRYTKPCARFIGGVRVGFGFRFERTCRPWTCQHGCGETENIARRRCRIFTFKNHQDVLMRNPQAVERAEQELGHKSDSLEGFRSDFIHFSISTVLAQNAEVHEGSGLHFTPKASAHFLAWWRLFNSTMSLPIRQGKMFPNSPPPSRKFGRNLATIKYRLDLHEVFLSHTYSQIVPELWKVGKTRSLGVKGKMGRVRLDVHQRRQERIVKHEKLGRTQVLPHKPFYAVDLLLDSVTAKLIQADFLDMASVNREEQEGTDAEEGMPFARNLPEDQKAWYNFFDYIDADRKPFDMNPRVMVTDFADCPHIYWSKRVKAFAITSDDDDESNLFRAGRPDIESSKFGREESHICYMSEAPGVAPTQTAITRQRIKELENDWQHVLDHPGDEKMNKASIQNKLRILRRHITVLSEQEHREIDPETLIDPRAFGNGGRSLQELDDATFENEVHIHNAKLFLNNTSRNMAYRYYYSNQDRKREEYTTSYASLRTIRDDRYRRSNRDREASPGHAAPPSQNSPDSTGASMVEELQSLLRLNKGGRLFSMPADIDSEEKCLRLAKQGLPKQTRAKSKNRILVLKPQVALHSEREAQSILLLAMEEMSFRGFQILDEQGTDSMSADIMTRNYISMSGLQAFYPTEEIMSRCGPTGIPKGLDFLPLEIFLDVKSEATDFDRIVLKTDAALGVDKFNHLRLPRGLEWPDVANDVGARLKHLSVHQDLTTIVIPRLTVTATSKHYTALYNIITDLLMYQDPRHRDRANRIDDFIFAFDRRDRDVGRLLLDLFHLQRSIHQLNKLQRGYEANADLITDEGKRELFNIRTDVLDATEQLFTVFEAIAVNAKRDDARAAMITSHRMDVAAGGIAWHMLRDDLQPLVKLDIDGTLFSFITNKDGSTDSALVLNDLSALNSNHDAIFPEIMVRYDASGRRGKREPFASAAWSVLAPVGGIEIVRNFTFASHPLNFRLEERVGKQMMDYVFNDRVQRRQEKKRKKEKGEKGDKDSVRNGSNGDISKSSSLMLDMPALQRSQSSTSVASSATQGTFASAGANGNDKMRPDAKFTMIQSQDAAEMRLRASTTKTFERIRVTQTVLILSYKSDDTKKHSGFTMPDCVDFKIKLPELRYAQKTWGYEDIIEAGKRDFKNHVWAQSGDLFSQIFQKTSIFRSKKTLRKLASIPSQINADLSRLTSPPTTKPSPSRLKYVVDPPTPAEEAGPSSPPVGSITETLLTRVRSRRSSKGEAVSPVMVAAGSPSRGPLSAGPGGRRTSFAFHDLPEVEDDNGHDAASEGEYGGSEVGKRRGRRNDDASLSAPPTATLPSRGAAHSGESDVDRGKSVKGFLLGKLGRKSRESTDDLRLTPERRRRLSGNESHDVRPHVEATSPSSPGGQEPSSGIDTESKREADKVDREKEKRDNGNGRGPRDPLHTYAFLGQSMLH